MPTSPRELLLVVALVAFSTLALSACAEGPVVKVQSVARQRFTPSALVETLHAAPSRPFVVVARIHVQAPAGTPAAQVLAAIERKAADLGANAIILHNDSRQTASSLDFNPAGGNYRNSPPQVIPIYNAIAIRWVAASDVKSAIEH